MAIQQPVAGNPLNSPDHSLSHRVIANDSAAPVESIVVDSTGNVGIGTTAPGAYLDINPTFTGATTTSIYNDRSGFTLNNASTTITNYYGKYISAPTITNGAITNKYALVTEAGAGNVGIGTTNPTAQLSQQSVAANESAPMTANLIASTDTFTGTGTDWTDNRPGTFSFTHAATASSALTDTNVSAVVGNYYLISWTITRSAGTFNGSFGGVGYTYTQNSSQTVTYSTKAISTGKLIFNPSSDFVGTVSNLSVKQITGPYSPTYNIVDSTGASTYEVRSSLASLGNLFFGTNAGGQNISGSNNLAIGTNALQYNMTSSNNLAIGANALKNVTLGYGTGVGSGALQSLTTGVSNTALGQTALYSLTTGYNNNAFGVGALGYITSGHGNTAMGDNALGNNNTANFSNNSSFGYNSLQYITGGDNTAIGLNAGSLIADGTTHNTTSTTSTYLGDSTKALLSGDTNETVIGYNAIGLGSNTTVLGNASVTTLGMARQTAATTAGTALTFQSSGAVSGGTDLAGGDLTLKSGISTGTGTSSLHFFTATAGSSGSTDNTPTEKMTILGNGNVGIGTTSPTAYLNIKAGTASAGTAPLKLTSGTLNTTAEAGAVEFLTDAYYGTTTTNAVRRMFVMGTTGRATAQTAANASVATYTLGAEDASFEVSANILVTTSSAEAFTVTCSYTDEGNTARVLTMPFVLLAGTTAAAINFANGAVPYEGVAVHLRCKASTAITIATTGTFTGATYNAEGVIKKIA